MPKILTKRNAQLLKENIDPANRSKELTLVLPTPNLNSDEDLRNNFKKASED